MQKPLPPATSAVKFISHNFYTFYFTPQPFTGNKNQPKRNSRPSTRSRAHNRPKAEKTTNHPTQPPENPRKWLYFCPIPALPLFPVSFSSLSPLFLVRFRAYPGAERRQGDRKFDIKRMGRKEMEKWGLTDLWDVCAYILIHNSSPLNLYFPDRTAYEIIFHKSKTQWLFGLRVCQAT